MNDIWYEIIQIRSENQEPMERIRTCASMIDACLHSKSSKKEKRELTNRLVQISSELGDFRRSADTISEDARSFVNQIGQWRRDDTLRTPRDRKKELIHEHLVPCAYLSKTIVSSHFNTGETFKLLLEYGIRCIVLKSEDTKINNAKLNKTMPEDWQIGHNPFIRYQLAGISRFTIKEKYIYP
ncbi:hypothetical protein [uncultured Sneathiella sp.]|uniref:hypothetical protein n=1 Tax=uncultured Sneathiella sp. TaxID=879315 RepID=UPI0030DADA6B